MKDPERVLQCILEGEIVHQGKYKYVLPNNEFKESLECKFRKEDPALEYTVVKRLAKGG